MISNNNNNIKNDNDKRKMNTYGDSLQSTPSLNNKFIE